MDYRVIGKWHSQLMMDAKDVIWSLDQAPFAGSLDSEAAEAGDGPGLKNFLPTLPGVTTLTSTSSSLNLFAEDSQESATDYDSILETTMLPNSRQIVNAFNTVEEKTVIPQSVCSFPCKIGEIMIFNTVSLVLSYVRQKARVAQKYTTCLKNQLTIFNTFRYTLKS